MKNNNENHKKVLSAFHEAYAKWLAKLVEKDQVQITLDKWLKYNYITEAYNLVILRMAKWYAIEVFDNVKKRFKHAKKELKHAKNKIRLATLSLYKDRTLQIKKQKQNKTALSKFTCSICLEQSSQIKTICDHKFCRKCFKQHKRMSKRFFLCSYCRKNFSRDHEDFVWVTS